MRYYFILVFVFCTFFFLCSKNPTGPSISKYQPIKKAIMPHVEDIRGLKFLRDVHLASISRSQYAASRYSGSSEASNLYYMELKQLGFVPEDMDIDKLVDSYNENFAAAFYVPGTDSIYLINPEKYEDVEFEFYIAHELTHALQDQHFNPFTSYIYPLISQSASNSDFYLSQLGVIEGDASFSGYLYFINQFTLLTEQALVDTFFNESERFYQNIKNLEDPKFLDITQKFPYILGEYFIGEKKVSQGWEAVNRLYHSNRVNSTAEIITGKPVSLVTFDFSKFIPEMLEDIRNLRFADDDTHGPVMLMALISEYTDITHCKDAFGWRGDRIFYVLKDNAKYGSFIWAIEFQSNDDADYMMNTFDKLLSNRRLSNTTPQKKDSTNMITFTHPGISTSLFNLGTTILWVENVSNPTEIAGSFISGALAKTYSGLKNYSTLPKDEKWKLFRHIAENQPRLITCY
jgi:hypothetical protein